MSKPSAEINTPPGRFVFGDLYEPETEDFDGNPMVIKNGADKGKPTQRYVIGIAIRKTQSGHWANEPGWGQTIWATGHAGFPGGEASRDGFSWKIYDGDSTVILPKSKSKVPPCEREGWAGCWVLRLQSAYAPEIWDAVGANAANPVRLNTPGAVLPGYVIQVIGTVTGNEGASPGVYLNHAAVGLVAYANVISARGVDVKGKFGGALPPGASLTPPAASIPAPAPAAAPAYAAPPQPVYKPAAAPTAVVPAPGIFGIPGVPAAPPAPAAAPAAPAPPPAAAVKPPHKGVPYDSYRAAGWTDEQLKADGYAF